jgi:hypothetical protein
LTRRGRRLLQQKAAWVLNSKGVKGVDGSGPSRPAEHSLELVAFRAAAQTDCWTVVVYEKFSEVEDRVRYRGVGSDKFCHRPKRGSCRETRPLCFGPLVASCGYFKASRLAPKLM